MKISIEKIIELVVKEVISELTKRGYEINFSSRGKNPGAAFSSNKKVYEEIDMSDYKTPVLTEKNIQLLNEEVEGIIVPEKTIITPGAKDLIKKKNLIITHKSK